MQRLDDRSRMSGDVYVRFCESLRGLFPWATRLIVGCEAKSDVHKVLELLKERFNSFSLSLHPEKTKLVAFGKPAFIQMSPDS